MSTVTKAISSVEFHVNARQANAALQSIQEEAKRCREQVEELQEQAAKGVTTVKVDGMDVDIQKRIREVKALQKTWESAAQSQIKGAKAFDELWKNARMGTIESMNGAQIKAGINASKPIYDRLRLGDAEDRMKAQAIKDMQDQGQKVLNQLKTTTDQIIKQIADGETIAADVLEREARNLKSIMDLLPPLSQEWKDYNLQYQAINQQIERQTVLERQLRGEIVTREDAIRVINAANREATQQEISQEEQRAKAAREAAEAKAAEADQYRTTVEQKQSEIFATNDLIAAKRREIDAHHESAAAAKNAADKAREAAYKDRKQAEQEARNQQDAYNKQKKIRDDAAKDVEKFRKELEKMGPVEQKEAQNTEELTRLQEEYNQKVERRKQLEQELDAIKNRSWTDDPEVKRLEEEIAKLNELIAVADKYKKKFAKMSDSKYEEGYMGDDSEVRKALHVSSDPRKSIWGAADYLKGAYHDRSRASLADFVKDQYPDDNTVAEYQQAAERVAKGIVQNAQENFRRAIYKEIQDGNWTAEAMEQQLDIFRSQFQNDFRNARPGELKDDPEYHYYKYIIEQMEKYIEVARQVEAERGKIAGGKEYLELARQKDDIDQPREGLLWQRQRRDFDSATIKTDDIDRRKKEDELVATEAVAKAKDEETESERKLTEAKKQSTTATAASNEQDEKRAGVQQKLTDAETRLADENRKLNEQADKTITANQQATQAVNTHQQSVKALGDVMEENRKTGQRLGEEMGELTKQHKQQNEELAEASEKMTDAEKESNRHIKTEQEARLRIQQLNNQSIEQLTASLRVLEEENRRINDPGNQRWQENERYIGQLNLRLEELKKQSAELRREPVLDMMTQRMQSLGTLSRDALTETKKFWEQMVDGAKKGSTELADYEQHLKSIALEEQARVREQGREAFAFFQREDYRHTNAADTEEQRKALVAYRDTIPVDDTRRIEEINALLEKHAQFVKEAAGEWMSLEKAMKLASKAGTDQFAGSAKDIQLATQALERQRDTIIATIREKRNLGQATKTEEDQLADLTKKLRSLKFEQDNVNMSQEKMRTLIETPANAVNLDELRAAIKRADGQLRQMQQSLGENSDEYKRFAEQVRNAKNVMKEMEGQAKASATAWEKAFSRLKTYVVMYMGFNEVWQKITGTARDLMDLSDRMGEVRKTTGFTADEVGRLSENLKKMDVRTSLTSLMDISASAGQLGLKTLEDVQGFTEAANKLMIALPEMGREAATEMMRVAIATGEVDKIRKQLQEGTIEGSSATAVAMEKIASTIDRLRATSASTAPEITDFVKRVGAVGAQSGITIDQVAALGSTVSSLGMRIEMSATALSRMIPAIRNNAFELAKAIGVTPDTIRNLFDTGRGMEVILMILQRIKDTGMDADSVEQMLGMAGMRDIMKDLNQQGARAGIVFSGLSQNVDELRRQLGVASEAYEENIAIQQEFDKMNETTAAKWERLKNALEEGFVGDKPQRLLGGIIDGLRKIVDFMVGDSSISSAFRTILVYLGLVRMQLISLAAGALTSVGGGLRNIGIMLGFIKGEMTKLQWGNIFTALAGAVLYAYMAFKDLKSAAEKAQESLGKTKDDVARAQEQFEGYWRKLKDTSTALEQARKSHDQLSAEVDKLRNSTDKGAAATENLRKKEDELKKSEDNVAKASNDHKTAISQMNSIYGKYLGFILTETNYANLAAAAHNKVAAAIEREMLMKQKQAAISEVDSNYSADIASNYGKLSERLTQQGLNRSQASQAMSDLQKFLRKNVSYDAATNETTVSKAVTDQLKRSGLNLSKATSNEIVALWYDKYLKDTYHLSDRARMNITGVNRTADRDEGWQNVYSPFATNVRGGYADTYVRRERERGSVSAVYNADITRVEGEETKAAGTLLQKLEKEANDAKTKILDKATSDKDRNDAYINLANALEGLDNRINELDPKKDAETINRLRDMAKSLSGEGISIKKLTAARREIHSTLFDRATFDENAIREAGNANPWGTSEPGESTNWKEMTAEQLVNRREQMNKFVNSLQTDTDVKAVLAEDKALMKAFKGRQATMREVVEWYNQQRLLIQDELHARHLTNTGDWLDPKKERGAKKQFRDEMDAYLHELDAYYTERKTRIEEAGTNEGLTEAEIRNRTLANEMEWQQRRAELQKLYSRKQQEVTQEELDAIYHIISERTGDTESFVKAQIAKTNQFVDAIEKSGDKGAAIVHRWMSQVELDTERSYLKGQQALTKQMKAIEDIIDKERPFNGITKQLRESLSTMDILTGDMRKEYDELMKADKDMRDFNERQGRAELQRTTFLLGEAEQAYSTTIDRVMQQMREKGMTAWADWLSIRPEQQEALMAQLRQTYDAIQDAIKKEASQLKKQAEIMWNNILVPGGDGKTTMKQMLDRTVAQLGIDQGRVSRANSLIGAGVASDRVADKLAIQQLRLQLTMQEHYYNLMKKQGRAHVDMLNQQADAAERRGNAEEATRKRLDAQHAEMALNLATAKEETELAKQREEIIARTEESQNRLYTELRSWADLLTSSLQGVFEASSAGNREYYNELAKMNLTGKGGPGAGTYMVIENEGTDEARAHYEWLDQREALERQHEIEIQNAQAEAWRKLMDDLNAKMSEQITDWMNAAALDANTQAVIANTDALLQTMNTKATPETAAAGMQPISQEEAQQYISAMGDNPAQFWTDLANGITPESLKQQADTAPVAASETAENVKVQQPEIVQNTDAITGLTSAVTQLTERIGTIGAGDAETATQEEVAAAVTEGTAPITDTEGVTVSPQWPMTEEQVEVIKENTTTLWEHHADAGIAAMTRMAEETVNLPSGITDPWQKSEEKLAQSTELQKSAWDGMADIAGTALDKIVEGQGKVQKGEEDTEKKMVKGSQSMFAKMTAAANLYGVAYQAMSNDNLSTAQKFEMIALQAAGNTAIAAMTADFNENMTKTTNTLPQILAKCLGINPIYGPVLFAGLSAVIGGLMGMAASKLAKGKAEVAKVTGASASAGRLSTGMMTYAEGNVNELTDPASLTPGRQYNVDGADGKTYRARYMGKGAKTHITNGPEFHLVGEAGREAIIDAKTTRLLQMNETGIWRDIQTLYNGGSISGLSTRRRRGGVRAFADGNIGDFEEMADGGGLTAEGGADMGFDPAALQASLDRNSEVQELLLERLQHPLTVAGTGPNGVVAMYDKLKQEAERHGEKYI